jgi:hypothetical protein
VGLLQSQTPSESIVLAQRYNINASYKDLGAICDAVRDHVSSYPPSGEEILKVLNKKI